MNNQDLRKVKFSLNFPDGFIPDEKEQGEVEEMSAIHHGLFHGSDEVYENGLKSLKLLWRMRIPGKCTRSIRNW